MTKNIFVVLGVARGGTSAVARALQALGIDLGTQLVDTDTKWNAKGFFEDSDVVYNINGKAFRQLNFAPYSIEMIEAEKQTSLALRNVKQAALDLLQQRFATTDYWGFKDPSTVKLLAFWQQVFATANVKDHYIICLRNPLGSARSYQKLTGCSLEVGLLLWLMHMLPAVANVHDKNAIVVSYEGLLKNPRANIKRLQTFFHLQALHDEAAINAYCDDFLDTKLHHNDYSRSQLSKEPAIQVVPLCVKAYDLFLQLANDEIKFSDAGFVTQWKLIQDELQQIYPVYAYMDALLKDNNQLKRTLKTIERTWVWKIYGPIKTVYDQLRAKRRGQRAEKRLAKAYG